jgi:hypothetical protein
MLKILGLKEFTSKVVPFYYYDNLTEIIHNEISEADRMTIIREKMGKLGPSGDGDISISTKVNLGDEFRHLVFNADELKNNLRSSAIENVLDFTKITEHDRGVDIEFHDPENVITFDGVINTIPRYAFDELAGHRKSIYAHEPVTFVNTKNPFKSILDPDYMVYTFNKAVFKRVLCKNGQAAIEYNASVDELPMVIESLAIDFPDVVDYTTVTIPYGRIISQKFEDTPRIIHVGRFAEWNHIISMEHVINKICLLNL